MNEVARFTVKLREVQSGTKISGAGPLQPLVDQLLATANARGGDIASKLSESEECTIVYFGCGSCDDGGARVEYYCSSSGGSQPDWVECQAC
ncbi:MAG: hypothetical protein H0W74_03775 [Sphingosinicella sp.]|nr:hypothetical protein [Sphingosinicella sp.]